MEPPSAPTSLPRLDFSSSNHAPPHAYITPRKRINDGDDVSRFLVSKAYRDIGVFLLQLNRSMCPRLSPGSGGGGSGSDSASVTTFPIPQGGAEGGESNQQPCYPEPIVKVQEVLRKLDGYLSLAPPDTGPRRFGNVAFRKWLGIVEEKADELLAECLPAHLLRAHTAAASSQEGSETEGPEAETDTVDENTLRSELRAYFTGSFGSKQRLDYGTGHELSFLAFLGCLWKLGVFAPSSSTTNTTSSASAVSGSSQDLFIPPSNSSPSPQEEAEATTSRNLVLGIIHPYLLLTRDIIKTYTLEPAGSHGVWGLDDHSFIPYILGSAQLSRPILPHEPMSTEGSLDGAPATGDVVKKPVVQKWRDKNLYFAAIGFINDVKTGPFWEHSPILFDISGVRQGWGKINKGMIKMYNAEVLSKFPVVQHFPFGSLFSWDRDPDAIQQNSSSRSVHLSAQPSSSSTATSSSSYSSSSANLISSSSSFSTSSLPPIGGATAAPWTQTASRAPPGASMGTNMNMPGTKTPATATKPGVGVGTAAPWASSTGSTTAAGAVGIPYSRVPPLAPHSSSSSASAHSSRKRGPPSGGSASTRFPDRGMAPPHPPPPFVASARGAVVSVDDGEDGEKDPKLPMPMTKAPWAK